jgi:hypothetical protein
MSKFKVPTTPKQIDKLIEEVFYTAHFRGVEISVMEIPALFKIARTAYIESMHEAPLTPESLDAAKNAMFVAMAQKMKKDGAL